MNFTPIDLTTWKRKELFDFYQQSVPCSYSFTTEIDIHNLLDSLKEKNIKFYPAFIWLLSSAFHEIREFHYAFDEHGRLGFYDIMHPSSVFFNKETELFGAIWTEYSHDLNIFLQNYREDMQKFYPPVQFTAKPATANCFHISNIPFFSFTGFHLHLPKGNSYLTPIFTMGKINFGSKTLPLAVQLHHSVCDGYHAGKFITLLQKKLDEF